MYEHSTYSKLINHNTNANYFENLDVSTIVKKILKIHSNHGNAKKKAIELEKFCIKKFNLNKFIKKIESLY